MTQVPNKCQRAVTKIRLWRIDIVLQMAGAKKFIRFHAQNITFCRISIAIENKVQRGQLRWQAEH